MAYQKQAYKQSYKQGQTQEQKVIKTQLLFDKLDNTFFALDELVKEAKTNKNQNELANICSFAVAQVNLFAASCKSQNKKGNERALHLLSYKLDEFCRKYTDNRAQQILDPYVQYIQCAVNGYPVKVIPAIKTNDDDWTDDVANNFMSNYLGSQHVVDDKVSKYQKQQKKLEKEYQAIWKANKYKLFHVVQNPQQLSAEQFYKVAGIGLNQIDITNKPSSNMSLRGHLDLFGGDDDHHDDGDCGHGHGKNAKNAQNGKKGKKGKKDPKEDKEYFYKKNKTQKRGKKGGYYDDDGDYNFGQ